jgi:hypothetical protein
MSALLAVGQKLGEARFEWLACQNIQTLISHHTEKNTMEIDKATAVVPFMRKAQRERQASSNPFYL